jgi:hypothetical protein
MTRIASISLGITGAELLANIYLHVLDRELAAREVGELVR